MRPKSLCLLCCAVFLVLTGIPALAHLDNDESIIEQLPATPTFSATTIPSTNEDLNPYGVTFVPHGFRWGGLLDPGDILVSNFNDSGNIQGTGTTIVAITPAGEQSVFFQGPAGLGLTTALGVLKRGFVLVGNVPTSPTDNPPGTCTTVNGVETGVEQGSLLILDRFGNLVMTLTSKKLLNGPWDLTIREDGDDAQVFVSNVLSGTVTRIDLQISDHKRGNPIKVRNMTQIASGYLHRCDPAALVVGPTGLAYDNDRDILYVASTGDNAIFAIRNARRTNKDNGMGKIVVNDQVHLHGPLGLVLASNGNLITSQGDAVNPDPNQLSEIVEFTPRGQFVAEFSIDPVLGSAFGIAFHSFRDGFTLAAVDDTLSVLDVWVVHR